MDEPWRPYTKWNTPITKRYILYDPSYEAIWVLKLIEIAVVARGWGRREQGVSVWEDGKVLHRWLWQLYNSEYTQHHWTTHLEMAKFYVMHILPQ